MLPLYSVLVQSSLLVPHLVFFLVSLQVIKGKNFLIFQPTPFLSLVMSFFHESTFPLSSYHFPMSYTDIFSDRVLPVFSLPSPPTSTSPNSTISTHSHRVRRPRTYLQDYHCSFSSSSSTSHLLSHVLSHQKLSPSYKSLIHAISSNIEPTINSEVGLLPEWQEAMSHELQAFEHNGTWSLTSLPHDKHVVGCKWVY